jgi:hypothetical protein
MSTQHTRTKRLLCAIFGADSESANSSMIALILTVMQGYEGSGKGTSKSRRVSMVIVVVRVTLRYNRGVSYTARGKRIPRYQVDRPVYIARTRKLPACGAFYSERDFQHV